MSSVSIHKVAKSYGKTQVIRDVSVDIDNNAFVVLLGPSGCGKSTLLRMIAGLEDVTAGEIRIEGRVVNDLPPKSRDIAMVFQNYALYPHMNVYDNMAFSLKLAKSDKATIERKVKAAADILGLAQYLDRYPRQLSGGQRQRVAMGRAIVRDPKVFLFDEPLSNLDAKLRVQMRTEIKSLHQRLNATCIYVTHDQIEAMTMADVIVVMRNGLIEQFGAPLDIYDSPNNLFVAGFIGSPPMNLIEGVADVDDGGARIRTDEGMVLPIDRGVPVDNGQKLVFGVRPGDLRLADDGGISCTVDVVEQTGSETLVFASAGKSSICAAFPERHGFRQGAKISLLPRPDRIHVFDAASGLNLTRRDASAVPRERPPA